MFYKINSSRVTLREYWWGTPNPLVILGWLAKWLRVRLPGSVDDPNVESLEPFRAPPDNWPEAVRQKFESAHVELDALGFHTPVCYHIHDGANQTDIYQAVYLHRTGQAAARVHCRIWHLTRPPKEYFFTTFLSRFSGGTYLATSSGKPDMLAPPSCPVHREVGASADRLWELHQRHVQENWSAGSVVPVRDERDLTEMVESHHRVVRDFHVERGVFVPIPPEEESKVATATIPASGSEPWPAPNAAVLSEIERLQKKSTGWVSALMILVVSVALFVAIGAANWDWKILLLLLPVLFLHELGHYLAMRVFRYRNLRMFFIPLFGAAVSGQHYNVPGWKKAVVSLMGPLPGIFLAAGLGVAGLIAQIQPLVDVAVLALLLNGFNLLPLLPLDGGWVMHSLFFSRHYVLDAAFRALAVGGLMLGGFLIGDWILTGLGIAMLLGLPTAFRLVRVVTTLRERGVSAASHDDQSIPPETAGVILEEIRRAFPGAMTNRNLAQMTVQAFEALNARPPGWLATFLLAGVHLGAFLIALVCVSVFILAQHVNLRDFAAAAATSPQQAVDAESLDVRRGAEAPDPSVPQKTIVATFGSRASAEATFEKFAGQIPPQSTLRQFGQSLLLAIPADDEAAREQWFTRMERETKELHVSGGLGNSPLSFAAIATDEKAAAAIEEILQAYFSAEATMHAVPPWHPELRITPQQELARKMYARLIDTRDRYNAPDVARLQEKVTEAYRRGNEQRVREIQKQIAELQRRKEEARLEKLRGEAADPAEIEVIELYRARPTIGADLEAEWDEELEDETQDEPLTAEEKAIQAAREEKMEQYQKEYASWARKMGERLGSLPLDGDDVKAGEKRFSSIGGGVSRTGLLIQVNFLMFDSLVDGPPALVEWLSDRKCVGLKYQFMAGFEPAGEITPDNPAAVR